MGRARISWSGRRNHPQLGQYPVLGAAGGRAGWRTLVVVRPPRRVHRSSGRGPLAHQLWHRRNRRSAPAQRTQSPKSTKGGSIMTTNGTFQGDSKGRPYHRATHPLLEVKNLNVDYLAASGTVHAVTDVNFSLRRGEILGLAGESGSGKSTLAYAITRLLRPTA